MQAILDDLIIPALGSIFLGILGYGMSLAREFLLRQRFEGALGRAAGQLALELLDPKFTGAVGEVRERLHREAVQRTANYVRESIPKTLVDLGVPDDRLVSALLGEAGKLIRNRQG